MKRRIVDLNALFQYIRDPKNNQSGYLSENDLRDFCEHHAQEIEDNQIMPKTCLNCAFGDNPTKEEIKLYCKPCRSFHNHTMYRKGVK